MFVINKEIKKQKNQIDKRITFLPKDFLLILLICVALVGGAMPFAVKYSTDAWDKDHLLRQAKSMELAFTVIVNEYYLSKTPLYDRLTESRLSEEAYEDVIELTCFDGCLMVEIPKDKYAYPRRIVMESTNYTVIYNDDLVEWKLYKNTWTGEINEALQ